ncbi:MAG TPA: alginate lyase family protein [Telluria sp.]
MKARKPLLILLLGACLSAGARAPQPARAPAPDVARVDRARVLRAAQADLAEQPLTITAFPAARSSGGLHDFYSEGDYWWPDPAHPGGPYIQRDGLSNPANFVAHRRALLRLSVQVPALAAAWKLTGDQRYADQAAAHLRAWFIDPQTRLNPNLQYAQAIFGRSTGRGIGIIDTVHLVEVARAIEVLETGHALSDAERKQIAQWFTDYLHWLTHSKNGQDERNAKNNHGTCWLLQVAAFAHLTGDQALLAYARERFKTVLLPTQLAADGSLPLELKRTKPYGYALFDLEALATLCEILSTPDDNLWTYALPDGRGMAKAMAWMFPYMRDKASWLLKPDVMFDQAWPMRQASLLFAGRALQHPEYLALWETLPADSPVEEVMRNFFIRQPVLWQ